MTRWAISIKRSGELPRDQRLAYFTGLAGTLWVVTVLCTAIGVLLSGSAPALVSLGLVFLNPIYFILLFAGDVRQRNRLLALVFGAVLGPILHLASPIGACSSRVRSLERPPTPRITGSIAARSPTAMDDA